MCVVCRTSRTIGSLIRAMPYSLATAVPATSDRIVDFLECVALSGSGTFLAVLRGGLDRIHLPYVDLVSSLPSSRSTLRDLWQRDVFQTMRPGMALLVIFSYGKHVSCNCGGVELDELLDADERNRLARERAWGSRPRALFVCTGAGGAKNEVAELVASEGLVQVTASRVVEIHRNYMRRLATARGSDYFAISSWDMHFMDVPGSYFGPAMRLRETADWDAFVRAHSRQEECALSVINRVSWHTNDHWTLARIFRERDGSDANGSDLDGRALTTSEWDAVIGEGSGLFFMENPQDRFVLMHSAASLSRPPSHSRLPASTVLGRAASVRGILKALWDLQDRSDPKLAYGVFIEGMSSVSVGGLTNVLVMGYGT